jgi:hypothetical protein
VFEINKNRGMVWYSIVSPPSIIWRNKFCIGSFDEQLRLSICRRNFSKHFLRREVWMKAGTAGNWEMICIEVMHEHVLGYLASTGGHRGAHSICGWRADYSYSSWPPPVTWSRSICHNWRNKTYMRGSVEQCLAVLLKTWSSASSKWMGCNEENGDWDWVLWRGPLSLASSPKQSIWRGAEMLGPSPCKWTILVRCWLH